MAEQPLLGTELQEKEAKNIKAYKKSLTKNLQFIGIY